MKEALTLADMLTIDLVHCKAPIRDRNEAIERIGELMVNAGRIEKRYIDAMKKLIDELGAYMVIAPGIALLHARPDDGAIKSCLALMTLSSPVFFGHSENDPVDIVFGLAASDEKDHIKALTALAKRLASSGVVEELRIASSNLELFEGVFST